MLETRSSLASFNPPQDAEPSAAEDAVEPLAETTEVPTVLTKLQKWADYPSVGNPVSPTRFLPMKTPMSLEIISNWSLTDPPKHSLTIPELLKSQTACHRHVGLIIDLANHECLYADDVPPTLEYAHIQLVAKVLPPPEAIDEVQRVAEEFWSRHPDRYIAIHCAYGFNRTGFVVCSFLCQACGMTVPEALESFAAARPPGVKHGKFVGELYARYGNNSIDMMNGASLITIDAPAHDGISAQQGKYSLTNTDVVDSTPTETAQAAAGTSYLKESHVVYHTTDNDHSSTSPTPGKRGLLKEQLQSPLPAAIPIVTTNLIQVQPPINPPPCGGDDDEIQPRSLPTTSASSLSPTATTTTTTTTTAAIANDDKVQNTAHIDYSSHSKEEDSISFMEAGSPSSTSVPVPIGGSRRQAFISSASANSARSGTNTNSDGGASLRSIEARKSFDAKRSMQSVMYNKEELSSMAEQLADEKSSMRRETSLGLARALHEDFGHHDGTPQRTEPSPLLKLVHDTESEKKGKDSTQHSISSAHGPLSSHQQQHQQLGNAGDSNNNNNNKNTIIETPPSHSYSSTTPITTTPSHIDTRQSPLEQSTMAYKNPNNTNSTPGLWNYKLHAANTPGSSSGIFPRNISMESENLSLGFGAREVLMQLRGDCLGTVSGSDGGFGGGATSADNNNNGNGLDRCDTACTRLTELDIDDWDTSGNDDRNEEKKGGGHRGCCIV